MSINLLIVGDPAWAHSIVVELERCCIYNYDIIKQEDAWEALTSIDSDRPPDIIISELDTHTISGVEFYQQLHRKFSQYVESNPNYDAPYTDFIFYFPFSSGQDSIDLIDRIGNEFPKPDNILNSNTFDTEKLTNIVEGHVTAKINGYENEIDYIKEKYIIAIPSMAIGAMVTVVGGLLFYRVPFHPVAMLAGFAGLIFTALSATVTSIRNSEIKYYKQLINEKVSENAG